MSRRSSGGGPASWQRPSLAAWLAAATAANPFDKTWTINPTPIISPTAERPSPQDIKFIKVGNTWYGFLAEAAAGTLDISYYSCSDSGGMPDENWVHHFDPVIVHGQHSPYDTTLISAPVPIRLADGSFRVYAHGFNYSTGLEYGIAWDVDFAHFPDGPYTWIGLTIPPVAGTWTAITMHTEIILEDWRTPDGKWACIFGGALGTDITVRGGHAESVEGRTAWTMTPEAVMQVGPAGSFDSDGVHPVGGCIVKNLGAVGYAYYALVQGYSSSANTWTIGVRASPDRLLWFRMGEQLFDPPSGHAYENPGICYDAATGRIRMYITSALSGWRSGDYAIYMAEGT